MYKLILNPWINMIKIVNEFISIINSLELLTKLISCLVNAKYRISVRGKRVLYLDLSWNIVKQGNLLNLSLLRSQRIISLVLKVAV